MALIHPRECSDNSFSVRSSCWRLLSVEGVAARSVAGVHARRAFVLMSPGGDGGSVLRDCKQRSLRPPTSQVKSIN